MQEHRSITAAAMGSLFTRDFDRLKTELQAYKQEQDLWATGDGISNSAGNLALHLLGNVRHFIGHVMGGSWYTRDRQAEFDKRDVPLSAILDEIDSAASEVRDTLSRLGDGDMEKTYPINVFGDEMTTAYFLIHLHGHFNYHLGQINYHRRLISH